MKRNKWIWLTLILLNTAFIWGNSFLSGEQSNALSDFVLNVLGIGTGEAAHEPVFLGFSFYYLVRKIAHFTEFAALAVWWVLWLRGKDHRREALLLAGLLTPLIDETIQAFSSRTSSVLDVWIDLSGFALGIILCSVIAERKKKKKG